MAWGITATKTLSVGDDVEHGELSKPEPAGQARVRNPQGNECVAGCGADEVVARQLLQANEAALDGLRPKPEVAAKVPAFQVQSPQEQEILAATPSHPKALTALYWSYMLVCYVEHLWRFAWPAVLCLLNHSLLPVAVASFVGQLLIFTAGPWVGELMDNAPRVSAFNTLAVAQAVAMAVSAGVTIFALHTEATLGVTANALVFQPWFLVLVLAGGVERITGLASGVAFERDWVVQLAGPNRPIALANANAILRRVDLFCEIAGPLSFGWLLSNYNSLFCVNTAVVIMAISLPVLLGLVALTDRLSKGVLQRPRYTAAKLAQDALEESNNPSGSSGFGAFLRGWKQFLKQPVLPASIAYVLLFFNTVLAPGSLMTSFLTTRGLDVSLVGGFRGACAAMGFLATFVSAPLIARVGVLKAGAVALTFQSVMLAASVLLYFLTPDTSQLALLCFLVLVVSRLDVSLVGGFRGACAAMGFLATFVSAPLIARVGVLKAGAVALTFQSVMLAASVLLYFLTPDTSQLALLCFLVLVVLSRLGLWTYDVVDAQIFQTAIPVSQANIVGTTEVALASLAELVMLAVAIVAHDVSYFGGLAALSMASVLGATLIYWRWLGSRNADQRRLFPNEPHFLEESKKEQ
eukprot:jgi/Mesen1/9482/ME000063S08934